MFYLGTNILKPLTVCTLVVCQCQLLTVIEASVMIAERYTNLWAIGSMSCPCSKIIVMDPSLGTMICLDISFWHNNSASYGLHLGGKDFKIQSECCLFTPMMFVPIVAVDMSARPVL